MIKKTRIAKIKTIKTVIQAQQQVEEHQTAQAHQVAAEAVVAVVRHHNRNLYQYKKLLKYLLKLKQKM